VTAPSMPAPLVQGNGNSDDYPTLDHPRKVLESTMGPREIDPPPCQPTRNAMGAVANQ